MPPKTLSSLKYGAARASSPEGRTQNQHECLRMWTYSSQSTSPLPLRSVSSKMLCSSSSLSLASYSCSTNAAQEVIEEDNNQTPQPPPPIQHQIMHTHSCSQPKLQIVEDCCNLFWATLGWCDHVPLQVQQRTMVMSSIVAGILEMGAA